MARNVRRRDGKGFEREINTLTKLRTSIVLDDRITADDNSRLLAEIDALIVSLTRLIRGGLDQEEQVKVSASRPKK
jgi:hypothetical protein